MQRSVFGAQFGRVLALIGWLVLPICGPSFDWLQAGQSPGAPAANTPADSAPVSYRNKPYTVAAAHPRIFINQAGLAALAERCRTTQKADYDAVKQAADAAVKRGSLRFGNNKWALPTDLLYCGLCYLVERENKNPAQPYVDFITQQWDRPGMLTNQENCWFGYHPIAYDWIYDGLTEAQRLKYGDQLVSWLRWYTGAPEIQLKSGAWEYNQTWGPTHLNVMHSRDAIVQKLFISLAVTGAKTTFEADAKQFLDSWAKRVPAECIPAFDAMGGVWAESSGHGSYGPITVIPYAFAAWQSATGQNYFRCGGGHSFLTEESRWMAYLTMPYNGRLAFLDDGGGQLPDAFAAAAPMVARGLRDPLAQWFSDTARREQWNRYEEPWQRLVCGDAALQAQDPQQLKLPNAYLFTGAGHVYMRSDWDSPNATWAFFGVGPHLAGHAHDDEGHFVIAKQGALVSRQGGGGANDDDDYWGGSLIFNIVTIFDPAEKFRRNRNNENDGGLLRYVYHNEPVRDGRIAAYTTNDRYTYAAGDITKRYHPAKAKEVTRQFLYLRGAEEFFIVFDRVESTQTEFAKHFFLHVPTEPTVSGPEKIQVPGHVSEFTDAGPICTWLSLPEDSGVKALSTGRSRLFMRGLLPATATVVKRGGDGHDAWGHPDEPTGQYNHPGKQRSRPPICPWRLEVAAVAAGRPAQARVYFLHVFQIGAEGMQTMAPANCIESATTATVTVGSAGKEWKVILNKTGALGGSAQPPSGKIEALPITADTAAQDAQWQTIQR